MNKLIIADHLAMKLPLIAALFLAGCASSTGVIPIGKETYSISRTDNGPAASLGETKASAYREAAAFCGAKGKQLQVLLSNDVPRSFGQFPQTEIQFTCT